MIPKPPGSDSACLAGNGFQISKTRKSIKASRKLFQFNSGDDEKEEIILAAASSHTTTCGSFWPAYFAARSATNRPSNAMSNTITYSIYAGVKPTVQKLTL